MEKAVFLMVHGDGDYGAMDFEKNFNENKVYKDMVEKGVKKTTLKYDEGYGEEELYVSIHEFASVDPEFISFIVNEFMDYDQMKAKNFYEVTL